MLERLESDAELNQLAKRNKSRRRSVELNMQDNNHTMFLLIPNPSLLALTIFLFPTRPVLIA